MKKIYTLVLIFYAVFSSSLQAQNFYSIDTIQKIEITFSQSNWDYILDTAKLGSDSYTMAQLVKINGVAFDSVGVKYKGNSSFNPTNNKNPFHIELDHFKNHEYLGLTDIKLSNGFNEPSFVRETLIYEMLAKYLPVSRSNYAVVDVNGQHIGLYTNVEAVTKKFLNSRFYSKDNTFIFADNGGCNLVYKGPDSTSYYTPYTMKSQYGYNDLKNLCNAVKNSINTIENILDVDRTLWWLAFNNAAIILDSYSGASTHNYYLYRDHNGRFNPINWDLNGALGVFNNPGNGPALNVSQMQNLTPTLHQNDSLWPLINKLLAVPRYKKMYIAHMKTIVNENFANNYYYNRALYMQSVIDTAVQSDVNKFFSYTQFINNLNSNVISGPKTIPGITLLMNARVSFLNSTPEFQALAPLVSQVQASDTFPVISSNVIITANVTNATAVFLGYRNTVMDRFIRIQMFDDGLHGDGSAGDGVYGVGLPVNFISMQYYIYADNNVAGVFSPQRAEHDFYTLNVNYQSVSTGQLVINEFMALNNSTVQNSTGLFSDWIELHNTTSNDIMLDHLHLTDDASNMTKWAFPAATIVPANGYKIVWADEISVAGELHCNFKLSGNGEQIYMAYPDGKIIDSVSFGMQTSDVSFGRYPNGTGPFMFMPATFNGINVITSITEYLEEIKKVTVYPNPSEGIFTLEVKNLNRVPVEFEVYDILGNLIAQKVINNQKTKIDLNVKPGIYFCKLRGTKDVEPVIKIVVR